MLSGVPTKSPCTLIRTLIGNLYCSMSEFFLVCPPGNPEAKGGRAGEEAGDGGLASRPVRKLLLRQKYVILTHDFEYTAPYT
jgi:hypothetical protein